MSRLAAKGINFDNSINIEIKDETVRVKGPKGELKVNLVEGIGVKLEGNQIFVHRENDLKKNFQGLIWSLINNAVTGVSKGFSQKILIVGKGWRSTVKGDVINLQVGHSHPVNYKLPQALTVTQKNPGEFTLYSYDKQLLGQVCAEIQKYRPVEPYKQKGIIIEGQLIRKKERKQVGV